MHSMMIGAFALVFLLFPAFSSHAAAPFFGPHKYERTTGTPDVYSNTFPVCNPGATYTLIVDNGENNSNKASSAAITLNGREVVRQNEFSQKVDRIEKPVSLQNQNRLEVRLASSPGSIVTVSIICSANCPELKIDSPSNGAVVNTMTAIIKGVAVNLLGEYGVSLHTTGADVESSAVALTNGSSFAGVAPLQQGVNTITATARDACGYAVSSGISVTAEAGTDPVVIKATPPGGMLKRPANLLDTVFTAELSIQNPVVRYAWDFDGDGIIDAESADRASASATYEKSGLFFPHLTVTDSTGAVYSATTVLNVFSFSEADAVLKNRWAALEKAMLANDIDGALALFDEYAQEKCRPVLTKLQPVLPEVGRSLGNIRADYITNDRAEYRATRMEDRNGSQKAMTYFIYFAKDKDGLWKIQNY